MNERTKITEDRLKSGRNSDFSRRPKLGRSTEKPRTLAALLRLLPQEFGLQVAKTGYTSKGEMLLELEGLPQKDDNVVGFTTAYSREG